MRSPTFLFAALLVSSCVRESAPPPKPAAPAIRVEVWHDTICPWCRIGLHNLDTVLAGWDGPPIEVVHHPFLLEPNTPAEGEDLRARLGAKYGEARVEGMFARVTQVGAQAGVHFDWAKVQVTPQTAPSHVLIEWAPEAKRRTLVDALHRAYFEEGRNIGDTAVLVAIAQSVGFEGGAAKAAVTDPARIADVRTRAAAASRSGINGVPHFVVAGRALHGAQGADELRAALRAATPAPQ